MKKLHIILSVIIALGIISGAVWRFDVCKASKSEVIELAMDFKVYKLESYRRYLQERIWAIEKQYPNQYKDMTEYRRLVEELRQLDVKISAYYQKRGG